MLHILTSPRLATAAAAAQYSPRVPAWQQLRCEIPSSTRPFCFFHFSFSFFYFFSILLKRRQEPPKKNHKAKSLRWCSSWIQYSASSWVGCMFEKQRILHNNCESPLKLWIWSKYDQTFEIWSKLCIKHCLAFTESTNERPWLLQC